MHKVPRHMRQRAAAEPGRYARLSLHRSFEPLYGYFSAVWRAVAPTLVLLVVSTASAQPPARNESQTVAMVRIYRDHFEYGNSTFDTIDQLREVLRGRSIGYSVRECGAEDKLRELVALIAENSGGHPINILRERFDLKCE